MSETNNNDNGNSDLGQNSKLVGLLAQFDDPGSLIQACNDAREDGYTAMDAYTPFPVHGIDPALGIKRSMLPFFVLAIGLSGLTIGLGMQYYTNAVDWSPIFPGYGFKISGKPYFSLPANIPVTFEVIVLSSAFATFFGMWFLNKLPMLSNPLHRISRFKRVTNDKFFFMIETKDPKFDRARTEAQLNEWGAVAIEECRQDLTDTKLPGFLKTAGVLAAILMLLPPVAIFRAKGMTNRQPRLHVMPDMDWQDKNKTQTLSPNVSNDGHAHYLFVDDRAMRAPVAGSIARGHLQTDTEFYQGIKQDWKPDVTTVSTPTRSVRTSTAGSQDDDAAAPVEEDLSKYVTAFPAEVEITEATLARGRQRFEIYCSVCHGFAGNGDGLVNQRAVALASSSQAQWTAAKSLHEPDVKSDAKNPLGRIFETISGGRNTMGPYASQIPVEDRWLIVAYIKALQQTGIQPASSTADDEETKSAAEDESTRPKP